MIILKNFLFLLSIISNNKCLKNIVEDINVEKNFTKFFYQNRKEFIQLFFATITFLSIKIKFFSSPDDIYNVETIKIKFKKKSNNLNYDFIINELYNKDLISIQYFKYIIFNINNSLHFLENETVSSFIKQIENLFNNYQLIMKLYRKLFLFSLNFIDNYDNYKNKEDLSIKFIHFKNISTINIQTVINELFLIKSLLKAKNEIEKSSENKIINEIINDLNINKKVKIFSISLENMNKDYYEKFFELKKILQKYDVNDTNSFQDDCYDSYSINWTKETDDMKIKQKNNQLNIIHNKFLLEKTQDKEITLTNRHNLNFEKLFVDPKHSMHSFDKVFEFFKKCEENHDLQVYHSIESKLNQEKDDLIILQPFIKNSNEIIIMEHLEFLLKTVLEEFNWMISIMNVSLQIINEKIDLE